MQFRSRGVFQRSALNEFNEIDVSVVVNVEGVCNSYYKQCYDFFGTSNT